MQPTGSGWKERKTWPAWLLLAGVCTAAGLEAGQPGKGGGGAPKRLPAGGSFIHHYFPRYREIMTLKAKPAFMLCADVNDDKIPDLLVGYPDGVQLFLAAAGGYSAVAFKDVTAAWGLEGASGKAAAFGDVNGDGRPDLLLGEVLYVNDGTKYAASAALPKGSAAGLLAVGLAEATGDGKPDALLVTPNGRLTVFENSGGTKAAWTAGPAVELWKDDAANPALYGFFNKWGGDDATYLMVLRGVIPTRYSLDGKQVATDSELTGQSPLTPREISCATMLSVDGTDVGGGKSGGPDLYVAAVKPPDLLMINRSQGYYLFSQKMGEWRSGPGTFTPETAAVFTSKNVAMAYKGALKITPVCMAAADYNRNDKWEELLFVTADLKLHLADNIRWPFKDPALLTAP